MGDNNLLGTLLGGAILLHVTDRILSNRRKKKKKKYKSLLWDY
jgi:hypothetical protein